MNKKIVIATARVSYKGADRLDITLRSALPEGRCLAPDDWNMVNGVKDGTISWEDYSTYYRTLIWERYMADPTPFLYILLRPSMTLCCYCTDHEQCHRTLAAAALKWMAEQHSVEVELAGERDEQLSLL